MFIKKFNEIGIADIPAVGGKNASLGEMFGALSSKGIAVPAGFAVTSFGFEEFLTSNALHAPLHQLMEKINRSNWSNLDEIAADARNLMLKGAIPPGLSRAIVSAYKDLIGNTESSVAVRSSATAEDLPDASFAGQHESYLNVFGENALLEAVKKCFASMYTARAIQYRENKGYRHEKVALSVGIQKMVRSDKGCSGVAFTLEPESGFRDIVHISGVWGLGENMVQGTVTPDEFYVFKPTLRQGKNAIVRRCIGSKSMTMVYRDTDQTTENTSTAAEKRLTPVLSDAEITTLAQWCLLIEKHYGKPMDIEWAKDGLNNHLYILQARPETVHSQKNPLTVTTFSLGEKGDILTSGQAIGRGIATGKARLLASADQANQLKEGEILVTDITSPDWDPVLKKAAAIITNKGGRTSHAAIVAREIGVPAIVGCNNATQVIKDGDIITVSCTEGNEGFVYSGRIAYKTTLVNFSSIKKPAKTKVMLIASDPDTAYKLSFYPSDGIGLLRLEFIITHAIQVHPMALVNFASLKDTAAVEKIQKLTSLYKDKKQFFIDRLAEGIATMASAFYPREVIVRTSDFKTNEYAHLIGGNNFEPREENPMLGFRGASRYYNDLYREGFRLECAAIKKVRDEMGLTNVKVMIPFCRTIAEANKVVDTMRQFGLEQEVNGLEIYVMAEIPANVILAEQFAAVFDGFSIGSNDLTQLVLGVDRDSAIIKNLFNEKNEAVTEMIASLIKSARRAKVPVGLCGQAPSDYPEFAQFLVNAGIDSISFNPDALLQGIENINKAEEMKTAVSV